MVVAPPVVMRVAIRCTGKRKSGDVCNQLLAWLEAESFSGKLEIKCPCCGEMTTFR